MKTVKKLCMSLAALFLMAGIFIGCCVTSSAAELSVPQKVRVFPRSTGEGMTVKLQDADDTIKNIKSSSSYLKVRQIGMDIEKSNNVLSRNERHFVLYSTKTGEYKVSFDIYGANNKKKASKTVTVYVKDDSPVKSYTLNGRSISYDTTLKSGAFRVTMNSGYTLKKIEVGKNKRIKEGKHISTTQVFSTIKNGANVTLSTVPYEYAYENGSINESYYQKSQNKSVVAETIFRITYIDKYTKSSATTFIYVNKILL